MFIGEDNIKAEDGSRGACVKVIDIVLFSGTLKLATFNTVDIDGRLDSNLLHSFTAGVCGVKMGPSPPPRCCGETRSPALLLQRGSYAPWSKRSWRLRGSTPGISGRTALGVFPSLTCVS